MHKRIIVILICALAFLLVAFAQTSDNTNTYKKNPKLESLLTQMISSDNPKEFAKTHNLYLKDGSVRVVVELTDKAALLPDYVIEETRYEKTVQIMVPIEKIVSLSSEPNVTFIRTPSKPYVDTPVVTTIAQTPAPSSGFNTGILLIISIIFIFLIKKKGDIIFDKK